MKRLQEDAYRNKVDSDGETVYELITAATNAEWGLAVADIDASRLHVHQHTREIYVVVAGSVDLTLDERVVIMQQGEVAEIPPGTRHMARARNTDRARVIVITLPAWTFEDHHLLDGPAGAHR